ncbi:bifunctional glycosyltransferase family 2/GtrA family protein [Nocardioides sp. AN3]
MTALAREPWADDTLAIATAVELVIPVHNEEHVLERSVRRLDDYLCGLPYRCRIVIADNASTDGTWRVAEELAAALPRVRALHLADKGRGRALKAAWATSTAEVVGYMDVDLSTDLRAIAPLVAPLLSGHSDLAIGSRLARGSRVVRGPKREIISRCYNLLLRGVLATSFSDAQCGFKAIRRDVAERLVPQVQDGGWFFDTELLVLAEEAGLRIHEVPVDWNDDPDSRVDIVTTALDDLRGVRRLFTGLASGRIAVDRIDVDRVVPTRQPDAGLPAQVVMFAAIGLFSTLAYLVLYLGLRLPFGAQAANLLALLVTTVANTAVNRRLTFGIRARRGVVRHHAAGLAAFAVGLALTCGSLALLHSWATSPSRAAELTVLVLANAVTTLLRFGALRRVMG